MHPRIFSAKISRTPPIRISSHSFTCTALPGREPLLSKRVFVRGTDGNDVTPLAHELRRRVKAVAADFSGVLPLFRERVAKVLVSPHRWVRLIVREVVKREARGVALQHLTRGERVNRELKALV